MLSAEGDLNFCVPGAPTREQHHVIECTLSVSPGINNKKERGKINDVIIEVVQARQHNNTTEYLFTHPLMGIITTDSKACPSSVLPWKVTRYNRITVFVSNVARQMVLKHNVDAVCHNYLMCLPLGILLRRQGRMSVWSNRG